MIDPWEEVKEKWQPPCPFCTFTMRPEDSCVMFEDSDPTLTCLTDSCICWGGPDRECEDCWLASK